MNVALKGYVGLYQSYSHNTLYVLLLVWVMSKDTQEDCSTQDYFQPEEGNERERV